MLLFRAALMQVFASRFLFKVYVVLNHAETLTSQIKDVSISLGRRPV